MTDLRIKKSTRALLDASFTILVSDPHASLSEIASKAGVGRATLYRHYPTREVLIAAIAVESLQMIGEALAPINELNLQGLAAMEALVKALLPLAERFHFLQMIWTTAELDQDVWQLYEEQMNTIWYWISAGQKAGEINSQLSAEWIVTVLDSMLYGAAWMLANGRMNEQQIAEQFQQVLFNGIRP